MRGGDNTIIIRSSPFGIHTLSVLFWCGTFLVLTLVFALMFVIGLVLVFVWVALV